ncbi:GNAT family N-acetyltransferase [Nonomuraea sp. NPDC050556]|uniref:GNAT family N-acetyltransferase n=1 Tax=Nonomuraea sp. NPDC050556 TaxID=3364369 RepID=UPI00378D110E
MVEEHGTRVAAADPLVAGQSWLPEPNGNERLVEAWRSVGLASVTRNAPDSLAATWGPLVTHTLRARVCGDDPAGALGALLDRWEETVTERGKDKALSVTWPSRDTAAVGALIRHAYTPVVAIAARRAGTPIPPHDPGGCRIRRAKPSDLDAMNELYQGLIAYDGQFTWLTARPNTPVRTREHLAELLGYRDSWCWVAELSGEVVGILTVEPPAQTRWISPLVNAAPVAYLGVMYADPSIRGRGVGAALAATAHKHLDAAGVALTLLHHSIPNPLSSPFWARQGYRPVYTQWGRHLAPM